MASSALLSRLCDRETDLLPSFNKKWLSDARSTLPSRRRLRLGKVDRNPM
jgi:hypothetical protein